mgnify:CR=1 FL=1
MEEQEINKTIAEFMGEKFIDFDPSHGMAIGFVGGGWEWEKPYTTSLDACIPVVEKLDRKNQLVMCRNKYGWEFGFLKGFDSDLEYMEGCYNDKSPALALSTALAKVIKTLLQRDEK